jgi:hypothetical protein
MSQSTYFGSHLQLSLAQFHREILKRAVGFSTAKFKRILVRKKKAYALKTYITTTTLGRTSDLDISEVSFPTDLPIRKYEWLSEVHFAAKPGCTSRESR